ncbi:hypothetical protein B0H63DRAFT_184089 [Podospora didyma]|uniref:DUF1479 domain protein n=1 Tax=Podospora didyma TaxID=330526 RepID=A0AAE0NPX4_9PEZI|nr:hypothetical protein B0H63DRAFT_184089 [Podospora didyma]
MTTSTAGGGGAALLVSAATATTISTRASRSKEKAVVITGSSLAAALQSPSGGGIGANDKGHERPRCSQCGRRRTPCHHHSGSGSGGAGAGSSQQSQQQQQPPSHSPSSPSSSSAAITSGSLSAAARPRRISKIKHRTLTAALAAFKNAEPLSSPSSAKKSAAMDPPVLSFYGTEPVPLPSRFAKIKRSLVAGHEKAIEASWARLLDELKGAVEHIESRGPNITPHIEYSDIDDPAKTETFARDLKRYGVGVIRGVVPRADAQAAIDETVKYLETKHDFKAPPPQDPTCFDFFWTPAQVRTRGHPRVLQAQRFAMSLWDNDADDRMAIRFPIAYADRLRIHGANVGGVGPDATGDQGNASGDAGGDTNAEAQRAVLELLGDFASSTVIAQVDNGSLERWEPDGYGRGGTYDAIFKGEWEKYDPWDPTNRVSSTPDLYNGYGACSIFRMYQGVVALSTIEPGLIRLLPSPKLATAYFLLRPFFTPKNKQPERREGPEWDAFLDASNWELESDPSTIIHGAVYGHAQRLTELWHPHLHLRRTLVTIPTLQTGDYIVWHPDLAYHITSSNPNVMASRAPTPPPMSEDDAPSARPVSILVYVPAAPLTQTNALYLARQRKTFLRGHPSPDFDSTGSGLGSEASHAGRPGETEIAEVSGPAGLQSMGLAPFDVAPTPPTDGVNEDGDVEMQGSESSSARPAVPPITRAEAEVARLANIILFPDRYDFYMAKRNGTKRARTRSDVQEEDIKEAEE